MCRKLKGTHEIYQQHTSKPFCLKTIKQRTESIFNLISHCNSPGVRLTAMLLGFSREGYHKSVVFGVGSVTRFLKGSEVDKIEKEFFPLWITLCCSPQWWVLSRSDNSKVTLCFNVAFLNQNALLENSKDSFKILNMKKTNPLDFAVC